LLLTVDKGYFRGRAIHSSKYKNGAGWSGKNAIVDGCGNSGHDIANDLYNYGASVTMIQRNPTMVTHQVLTMRMLGSGAYTQISEYGTLNMPIRII